MNKFEMRGFAALGILDAEGLNKKLRALCARSKYFGAALEEVATKMIHIIDRRSGGYRINSGGLPAEQKEMRRHIADDEVGYMPDNLVARDGDKLVARHGQD